MRKIINFNNGWCFAKNHADVNVACEACEKVNLPHSWNAVDGQDGGNDYFRGTCLYTKELLKSDLPEGKCFIEIEGANSSADLYLNGKKLAHHVTISKLVS